MKIILFILLLFCGCDSVHKDINNFMGRDDFDANYNYAIVMVGDSITQQGNWAGKFGINTLNYGVGGERTAEISLRINQLPVNNRNWYMVMCGINDIRTIGWVGSPSSVEGIFENYKKIITQLRTISMNICVFSTLYQCNHNDRYKGYLDVLDVWQGRVTALNKLLKEYCDINGVLYIDLNYLLSSNMSLREEYTTDGTHLNSNGYAIWESKILEILSNAS